MARWPSKDKIPGIVWSFVHDKMWGMNYTQYCQDLDKWYDFYRGRQWAHEDSDFANQRMWKVTYNELGQAIDHHISYTLSLQLRHYHLNLDQMLLPEERALNSYLVRYNQRSWDNANFGAVFYGSIYGAGVYQLKMRPVVNPRGMFRPDGSMTEIRMPEYSASPPWQWIWDSTQGDQEKARYAVKLYAIDRRNADRIAKRDVKDLFRDHDGEWNIKTRFMNRTATGNKLRSEAWNSNRNSEIVIGCEIWFRNVDIGAPLRDEYMRGDDRWRYINIFGDHIAYFNFSGEPEGDSPIGQNVGIPAVIFSPHYQHGYLYGRSDTQIGMDIQRDVNAKRALASEIAHYMGATLVLRGKTRNDRDVMSEVARIMKFRGRGILPVMGDTTLERLRGDRVDPAIQQELGMAEARLEKRIGMPSIMMGQNPAGNYSAEQSRILVQQASAALYARIKQYRSAIAMFGEKEWEAIRNFWDNHEFLLNTGQEYVAMGRPIFGDPNWKAEAVPENMYAQAIAEDRQETVQQYLMGILDPVTGMKAMTNLTNEERERALQYQAALMQSQVQSEAPPAEAQTE